MNQETQDIRVQLRKARENRAETFERSDVIMNRAERENRDFHPDERRGYDKLMGEMDEHVRTIERLERELDRGTADDGSGSAHRRGILLDDDGNGNGNGSSDASSRLLTRSQPIASRVRGGASDEWDDGRLSIGGSLRGLLTGRWDGHEEEQRALSSTTLGAGGALVPTPLATAVIDRVRNEARVLEAGAQTVVMTSETLKLPRLLDDPEGAWRDQNQPVAEDDAVFDTVELHARTLAVLIRVPWELGQDMTPEAAAIIEGALVRSLSAKLDLAALRGTGSQVIVGTVTGQEPLGVRNQPGVTIQSLGVNGAPLVTYAPLIAGVGAVWAKNHRPNAQLYSTRTALAIAGWTASDGQPLQPPPILADVRQLPTNQIPDTLTQGTSNDTSEIYTGDWAQLIIGFRPALGVQVVRLDQTFADRMQTGILAYLRADVAVAHAGAFAVTTGVRPAA